MNQALPWAIAGLILSQAASAQESVPAPTLFLCDTGLVVHAEFHSVDSGADPAVDGEADALRVAPAGGDPVDCAPVPGGAALVGDTWSLVQFQSSSDEIGTLVPNDPATVTLDFMADGRVAMRLDCNRGSGTWNAAPSDATGGVLEFGPVAATRAACPPGSLGDRFAADLPRVRSYTLRDGQLNLALQMDGGIWTFGR